eukprot:TRINITY_DN16140_c0_g1_i1.p3 TRINITY_DN16140_c0_g1~~TRINITY_DN16140_c0_g1_i1.p3  ORF type:complete len:134 (+),score=2.75 TRINITY_DN16140_c0_g1_i1:648-1049(+)
MVTINFVRLCQMSRVFMILVFFFFDFFFAVFFQEQACLFFMFQILVEINVYNIQVYEYLLFLVIILLFIESQSFYSKILVKQNFKMYYRRTWNFSVLQNAKLVYFINNVGHEILAFCKNTKLKFMQDMKFLAM